MNELLGRRTVNLGFTASQAQAHYGPKKTSAFAPMVKGRTAQAVVFIFLAAILLGPPVKLSRHSPYVRPEQILLVILGYLYLLGILSRSIPRPKFCYLYAWGVLFSMLQLTSLAYGVSVLHHEVVTSDFYELLKVWLVVALFMVGYEARLGEPAVRRFLAFLGFCTIPICLFGVAQYLRWSGAMALSPYFATAEHNIESLADTGRIYATFGNPNVFGQFLASAAVCLTIAFFSNAVRRSWGVFLVLLIATCMIMTGSRYALLSSALACLLLVLASMTDLRRLLKIVPAFILVGVFVWGLFGMKGGPSIHTSYFQEFRDPMRAGTVRQRLDVMWKNGWDQFSESPILGHGPSKAIFSGEIVDSEYLEVLRRYGVLGLAGYISLFFWIFLKLKRAFKYTQGLKPSPRSSLGATTGLVQAGFIVLAMDIAMNVGMFTFYNFQFGAFFWLFMGLAVRAAESVEHIPMSNLGFPGSSGASTGIILPSRS